MANKHSGSCLCGQVKYEVTGAFEQFFLCHCSHCRKGSGSAHCANLFSNTAQLTWLQGKDNVRTYTIPNTRHCRSFCSNCGAALPTQAGGMLVLPAGSLDSDVTIKPTAHLHIASKANWDEALETAPKFEELPG